MSELEALLETIASVEIGFLCWHRLPVDPAADHKGGVVYDISEQLDQFSGEMERVFHTVRAHRARMRFDEIHESDLGIVEPRNVASIRNAIRGLARDLGERKGYWDVEQQQLIEVMYRLAMVLLPAAAGGRGGGITPSAHPDPQPVGAEG